MVHHVRALPGALGAAGPAGRSFVPTPRAPCNPRPRLALHRHSTGAAFRTPVDEGRGSAAEARWLLDAAFACHAAAAQALLTGAQQDYHATYQVRPGRAKLQVGSKSVKREEVVGGEEEILVRVERPGRQPQVCSFQ